METQSLSSSLPPNYGAGETGDSPSVISYAGLVGFTVIVIQFNVDQLPQGKTGALFIHWYVWGYYTTICTGENCGL